MKSLIRVVAGTGLAVGILAAAARAGTPGLSGSGHDFAKGAPSWNPTGEMCLPCHIPHLKNGANTTYKTGVGIVDSKNNPVGAALWNHALSAGDSATYTLFTSWTTTSTIATGVTASSSAAATPITGNVDQTTKLCLGCHDGTIALASFNVPYGETKPSGTGATVTMATVASFAVKGAGNDLTATHPIGDAAIWPFPNDPTKFVDPSARDAAGIMPLRAMATGQLAVGCSSCHDPHNAAGNNDFLWVSNNTPGTTVDGRQVSGSVLCENCHVK